MNARHPRVFVALSGGVDSSMAAALLKERGFDVVGIHMKMWAPLEARADGAAVASGDLPLTGWDPRGSYQLPATRYQLDTTCRQQYQDRLDAMAVAATLDIPFQTWDFTEEYRKAVVEYMIREYAAGRTPNPDVMCNRHIKFGLFLQKALEAGADYVATGHYVKIQKSKFKNQNDKSKSKIKLLQAKDKNKDQSYFLWTLTQRQLLRCLFPISEYTKPEVREIARLRGLPTADKPDSQGVCFIGEIDVRDFLKTYIPERRGRVLTTAGRVVGQHDGAEFYTIGQRQGIGIGGAPSAPKGHAQRGGGIPYYVAEKNLTANTLTVAEGPYDEKLYRRELVAADINWISGRPPAGRFPLRCEARIRYRQPLQKCTVQIDENGKSAASGDLDKIVENTTSPSEAPPAGRAGIHQAQRFNNLIVTFDEPQRAVTPGQSIVFYRNGEMLGGGIIA